MVQPTTSYWHHTFLVKLPQPITYVKSTPPCRLVNTSVPLCHLLHDAHRQSQELGMETNKHLTKLRSLMNEAIPILQHKEDSITKRAILPFIGQISHSLFGTATDQDVEILSKHIRALESRMHVLSDSFQHQGSNLASYMKTINERVSSTINAIQINNQAIASLGNELWLMDHSLILASKLSAHLTKEAAKGSYLLQMTETLLLAIHQLHQGRLSPTIIPKSVLQMVIHQIKHKLSLHYPNFHLTHSKPDHYYKTDHFLYSRQGNSLYVTLKLPLSSVAAPLQVFKVINAPLPINSSSTHTTILDEPPNYFAISTNRQYYSSLSEAEWSKCKGHRSLLHCHIVIPLISTGRTSCISALFFQQKHTIRELCEFNFIPNGLRPQITSLSDNTLILSNISHLTLQCAHNVKELQGCSFCTISIPCKCSLVAETFFIPATLHGCANITDYITKLHPINLAVLQHFLTDSDLVEVQGDSLTRIPVNAQIPPINLYQHKFSKFIASDKQTKHNLRRMMTAVKNNQQVFQTLTDPILAGLLPQTLDTLGTFTTVLTYVSFLIAVVAMILTVITTNKLRGALVALSTLQNLKTSEASVLPYEFKFPGTTTLLPTIDSHYEYTCYLWVLGLLFLSCIFMFQVYKWCSQREKGSKLCLQVSNADLCETIEIWKLKHCPTMWQFQATTALRDISSTGTLFPTLTIEWNDLKITNLLTQQTIVLPSLVRVSSLKARRIRQMLNGAFYVKLVLYHDGHATYIPDYDKQRVSNDAQSRLYPVLPH